jgi:hypothetical protein
MRDPLRSGRTADPSSSGLRRLAAHLQVDAGVVTAAAVISPFLAGPC